MNWRLIAAGVILFSGSSLPIGNSVNADDAAPATQPAVQTDIPVQQVVLFSSGVGYFEHGGKVAGNASTQLQFKTEQINDILKSLLLEDVDGGTVGAVTFPGLAPLVHTLKGFKVDITTNPDIGDLLNQLRGARITLNAGAAPGRPLVGVILGVEKKSKTNPDKSSSESSQLNLKVGRQIQSAPLDSVTSFELDDPALQKDLDDALAALAQARGQEKKPVTLHFNGIGDRRVRVGYLVETPIWKTSYRLVLDGHMGHRHAASAATRPTTGPATTPATQASLQGWAIVENQTDNDWNDVRLSLISGQPLSFIEDLYHSQYIPREVVQGNSYTSLRPQTYTSGFVDVPDLSLTPNDTRAMRGGGGGGDGGGKTGGGGGGSLFGGGEMKEKVPGGNEMFGVSGKPQNPTQNQNQNPTSIDPTASVAAAANSTRIAELFRYSIPAVTIARQTSAMIPIVTDDIEAERVSIFTLGLTDVHPLLGARVRNNTGKFLLQGPITVIDHGVYAGDARIEDLPPGQDRLLSFGIDQQMMIDHTVSEGQNRGAGYIRKGILKTTTVYVDEQNYQAQNNSDRARTLIIEHPRSAGFAPVDAAQVSETTSANYRLRMIVEPHKVARLKFRQEQTDDKTTQLLPISHADLTALVKDASLPKNIHDALVKAMEIRDQQTFLQSNIGDLDHQIEKFGSDQGRMRDNLRAVAGDTDYYKRLVKKMDELESAIEAAQKRIAEEKAKFDALDKQYAEYIASLNVAQ